MSSRGTSPSKLNVQASEWKPPTPPAAPASSRGESTPQKPSRTRRGGRSSRRGSGGNGNDGRRTPQPQREHAPRESKQAQQLKVHAPGCSCARLARTRGRHAAEGRASGYVVASRDAKAPDLHFGSDERDFGKRPEKSEGAPAGPGERTAQRPAAERLEHQLRRRAPLEAHKGCSLVGHKPDPCDRSPLGQCRLEFSSPLLLAAGRHTTDDVQCLA